LKIDALQKYAISKSNEDLKQKASKWTKTTLSKIVLCHNKEQEFPSTDCLTRKCDHCNVTQLSEFLQAQIDSTPEDEEIMWFKWELISIESDGGKKRVTSCVSKKSSFKDIIRDLKMIYQIIHSIYLEYVGNTNRCKIV
jgi:hypothetical protein